MKKEYDIIREELKGGVVTEGVIVTCMREYAKQEAIEFARWLECNYETYLPLEELYKIWKEETK